MTAILPEDLADFAWIAQSDRPLIVCDVDEVVLEFVTPFQAFLDSEGFELRTDSFKLHGNVFAKAGGAAAERSVLAAMLESFFAAQEEWQVPVEAAADALRSLADDADILFLTAMPPRHFAVRRQLLDRHHLPYPMIATEDAKGAVLSLVHGARDTKVVFIDDIFTNLHSVRDHLPNTLLINLMANAGFRVLAPDPGEAVARPQDWHEARDIIQAFLKDQRLF